MPGMRMSRRMLLAMLLWQQVGVAIGPARALGLNEPRPPSPSALAQVQSQLKPSTIIRVHGSFGEFCGRADSVSASGLGGLTA
ncbi:MAG: hypothetical protein ACRENS_11780, partial [Candidatus Eiseniibacteriota bacterium]